MIDWISSWLRELVLIILIATFFELMLPSNKFQRYVRVVFSLFLLLTMLGPVLAIFELKIEPSSWFEDDLQQAEHRDVEHILKQADKLKMTQIEQSVQLAQQQAEQLLLDEITSRFPVNVEQLNLTIRENDEALELAQVRVVLTKRGGWDRKAGVR